MPTCRSINLELRSQFDIEALPEFVWDDFETEEGSQAPNYSVTEKFQDEKGSTCTVYVPIYPSSQFWIVYSISPPVPDTSLFLFKLFINNEHVISWSCGKEDKWRGKTMFGLFEKPGENNSKSEIEKRVLCFSALNGGSDKDESKDTSKPKGPDMEVRIFRAHGRKKVARKVEQFENTPHTKPGRKIDLVNAGRVRSDHPRHFYKFALIDPTDRPFASFRYYLRTWEEIRALVFLDNSEVSDTSTLFEEHSLGRRNTEELIEGAENSDPGLETDEMSRSDDETPTPSSHAHCISTSVEAHTDFEDSEGSIESPDEELRERLRTMRHSMVPTPASFYRLSIPPSLRLTPTTPSTQSQTTIPKKNDSTSSFSYRPHPAYPIENWRERTPSPIRSLRNSISTPTPGGRRGLSAASLMNVVSSAWNRCRTPSSESSRDAKLHN